MTNQKPVYGCYHRHGDGKLIEPFLGRAETLEAAAEIVRAKYHGVRYVCDYGHQFVSHFLSSKGRFPEIKVDAA